MKKQLEKDIQRSICDYLALKKYFFWRSNNLPVFDFVNKKFRAMPKYALKGIPDVILVKDGGMVVFIEIKRPKGVLSDSQIEFMNMCERVGATYIVAHSLDEIIKAGL